MTSVLSREQVRRVDQIAIDRYGMSGLVLMENAARGTADIISQCYSPSPVAILCGKGNNAGDGYAIARHLDIRRWPVRIVQLSPSEQLTGDAAENWRISQMASIPTEQLANLPHEILNPRLQEILADANIIVDCMLGTGATGAPRFPFDVAIEIANSMNVTRIAVDIPTGLECNSGQPSLPCFKAERTCTFVASKPAFSNKNSAEYFGTVHVVDIGVPRRLLQELADETSNSME